MYFRLLLLLLTTIITSTSSNSSVNQNYFLQLPATAKTINGSLTLCLLAKLIPIEDIKNRKETTELPFNGSRSTLKQENNTFSRGLSFSRSRSTQKHKNENFPSNCQEVTNSDFNYTQLYTIQPKFYDRPFLVHCDLITDEGGWTVLLNRNNGSQDFYLPWNDYKQGFGNLDGDFWLGLEKMHHLTGFELNELLVELIDWDDKLVYAHYNSFSIGSEDEGYAIRTLGGYSGNAGDSLTYHAGSKFSTKDKDQDKAEQKDCATEFHGGWWFKDCRKSLLTGIYVNGYDKNNKSFKNMHWETFHGATYNLKKVRMMVRPHE